MKQSYTNRDCDFLICIVMDTPRFWAIPVDAVAASALKILLHTSSKYSKYENRWDLIL